MAGTVKIMNKNRIRKPTEADHRTGTDRCAVAQCFTVRTPNPWEVGGVVQAIFGYIARSRTAWDTRDQKGTEKEKQSWGREWRDRK